MNPEKLTITATTPDEVNPQWDAPWMDLFTTTQGLIMATVLAILVILMIVGLVMWVAGKLGGGGMSQEKGLQIFLWGLVAAVLVVIAGGAVMWATGEADGWFDFGIVVDGSAPQNVHAMGSYVSALALR